MRRDERERGGRGDLPSMFPGRASCPKKCGLAERAVARWMRRVVRPSSPTMGFVSLTCIASATRSTVMRASPSAVCVCVLCVCGTEMDGRTVDTTRLSGTRKQAGGKHVQARDGESFGAGKDVGCARLGVGPDGACAGVEEDGDEEEVDEAFALLDGVDRGVGPGLEERGDAGMTGVEVAPSAVREDLWQR